MRKGIISVVRSRLLLYYPLTRVKINPIRMTSSCFLVNLFAYPYIQRHRRYPEHNYFTPYTNRTTRPHAGDPR